MPGPTTEILNDDLKELRADFHRTEVSLTTALGRLEAAMKGEMGQLQSSLSKLAGEFGVFKLIVSATLGAAVSGLVAVAWTGGSLSSKVNELDRRVDRIESRMERMETGIGQILELVKKDKATIPTAPANR